MKYLPNHKKIMLIITENCNLRCVYCYEKNKNGKSMTFETAKAILDQAYAKMEGYESMVIELHGGEPFINFPLIEKIDAYVMENYGDIPVLFRMITNGTLVHGRIKEWLSSRAERYELMLSIDGKQEQHDMNRKQISGKGSFEQIDLDFFLKTWKNCPVSMTINAKTLDHMAEGTIWLQEKGFDCCNAFEWAVDWDLESSIPALKRELDKLIVYYSKHPEQPLCLLVKYHLQDFYERIDESYRYCIDIDDPLECYDAQGKYAPCHGFTAFTMGSEEKAAQFENLKTSDFVFGEENVCYGCQLIHFCRICFAANHMLTGNMQKQSSEICLFNRMCIRAGIQIQKNRIASRRETHKYEKEVLKSAKDVEKYLDALEERLKK